MQNISKNFWEKLSSYPSFNKRFWVILLLVMVVFAAGLFLVLIFHVVQTTPDIISVINTAIQGATLVLGMFAAYYALRQLVETRFTSLDQAGAVDLKGKRYNRAINKWKDAFYIKPEAGVFTNLCETLLLVGDYDTFDQYVKMSEQTSSVKREIFQEVTDKVVFLYLKSIRHLLVKNQGEAEKYISKIVVLAKQDGLLNFGWPFDNFINSIPYQELTGECKKIADNLIGYLSKDIPSSRKLEFENGLYASQVNDPVFTPRVGKLINKDGYVYYVGENVLLAFPDVTTFNSWGFSFAEVLPANSAEQLLPVGGNVPTKSLNFTDPLEQIASSGMTTASASETEST